MTGQISQQGVKNSDIYLGSTILPLTSKKLNGNNYLQQLKDMQFK